MSRMLMGMGFARLFTPLTETCHGRGNTVTIVGKGQRMTELNWLGVGDYLFPSLTCSSGMPDSMQCVVHQARPFA